MRVITLSQNKSKSENMKTFSAWWFSWYAAGRAENATTNHRRLAKVDGDGATSDGAMGYDDDNDGDG